MTQIAVHTGELYVTDYQAQAIRRTSKFDGTMSEVWAQKDSQHPWGLLFDHEELTFRYGGRDHRLTEVHGRVVGELLS